MPHQCPHCEYTTNRNNNMERHIHSIHIVKANKVKITEFKCNKCSKQFTTKGNCMRHEKICNEKSQGKRVIFSFTSKIIDEEYDLIIILSSLSIDNSNQDIITESIIAYNSNDKYKNIYITSMRSKICHTLNNNGIWEKTDKEYALDKRTKEFIEIMTKSLKNINVNNDIFNNFKRIWYANFGKMITNTKFYKKIKNIMEANIYNYTRQQFSDGKFSYIPCDVVKKDMIKPLTYNEDYKFDDIFCFTGKI